MIKKIVAFGCGWTSGIELENPLEKSYPALVAATNDWAVDNYAFQGATLPSMVLQVTDWLDSATSERIADTLINTG